jgi:CDGSH-type Zn-finger protein/uncharacterized Fe-S cluster protein YjdI
MTTDTSATAAKAPSREQLLYFLHEAAEIEHNLMCCYLYAAFSLKRTDAAWTAEQREAVARWRRVITGVALEEMTHLCLVGNLMNALGASIHLNRPMFPIDVGPYPAGFTIRLQAFSRATVQHFTYLERPVDSGFAEASGFEPQRRYTRGTAPDRLSPSARDYATVGELYATLRQALDSFAHEHGEAALFVGDPKRQVASALAPLPGVCTVHNLATAHQAIDTIVTQGEGAGAEEHNSHYCRFERMLGELDALLAADPSFAPAWPAATNPVMNPPPTPAGKVHINHPINARWLDVGNALYTASLRCLLQGFGATDTAAKRTWLGASFALMRALTPVGEGLAARPAQDTPGAPNAGLTFTSLRTLAWFPESTAASLVAARLAEVRQRAEALPVVLVPGESESAWTAAIAELARQEANLRELAGEPTEQPAEAAATSALAPATSAAPATAPLAAVTPSDLPKPSTIEVAKGRDITIFFEGARCIHSRFCVLEAPTVFKANTPGEWIYPDTMDVDRLVEVANKCPSGAIRYERHDGKPNEAAPPVNVLNTRENGPNAVHGQLRLTVVGSEAAQTAADGSLQPGGPNDVNTMAIFRATLCRCGASRRKPFCDGSHTTQYFANGAVQDGPFVASGEPPTGQCEALATRNGPLIIEPQRNGPLRVQGNLEMCAGTGRSVFKVGAPNADQTALCRCGNSRNKPFCDGSHAAAGFVADGVHG